MGIFRKNRHILENSYDININISNVTNGPSSTAILKVVINGNLPDEPSHPLSSLKAKINGNVQDELAYPETFTT